MDTDLVGIPVTLYTFGVIALSLAAFRFGGSLAGIVIAVGLWAPMFIFAVRGPGQPPEPIEFTDPSEELGHRVLVVANQGLEDPALVREVCRRGERYSTEVMIIAPVVGETALDQLTGDVDSELEQAAHRLDTAVQAFSDAGVKASGRPINAEPMDSVLDGLRQFPPNEIVILPGRETGWEDSDEFATRLWDETGLPVTEVSPSTD